MRGLTLEKVHISNLLFSKIQPYIDTFCKKLLRDFGYDEIYKVLVSPSLVIIDIRQNVIHARQVTTVRMELINIFAQLVKAHLVGNIAVAGFAQLDIIPHILDQRNAQNVLEAISVPDEIKIQCRVVAEKYLAKDIPRVANVLLVITEQLVVA